jgi:hypothetical protein
MSASIQLPSDLYDESPKTIKAKCTGKECRGMWFCDMFHPSKCRYGAKCNNRQCTFNHPQNCKYGMNCTYYKNNKCQLSHPNQARFQAPSPPPPKPRSAPILSIPDWVRNMDNITITRSICIRQGDRIIHQASTTSNMENE